MRTLLSALLLIVTVLSGQEQFHLPSAKPVVPNDPLFHLQASFYNRNAIVRIPSFTVGRPNIELEAQPGLDLNVTRAWAITTGARSVVVAILDDGFFYQHEDIRDNVWRNPGESGVDASGRPKETNGVDDDGNGYVDDVMGYDFAFDDPDPDAYIFDGMNRNRIQPNWHSIPALGIIGARGNNGIGVAGINWDTSLMLLKIGAQGIRRGEVDPRRKILAAKAVRYAVDNGARVINWSGFVDDKDLAELQPLQAAFDYAESRGVLIVLGAGNNGTDFDLPQNAVYPQAFRNENILRVAEINFRGALDANSGADRISASTFGKRTVHLAAIARNYTTVVHNGRSAYHLVGGTSNSAPVVTGVAALVLSIRPDFSGQQVKHVLMASVRRLPSLEQKLVTGGVIDAHAALSYALRYGK